MKIYISPERRPNPHGKYWGYADVYEHDVCCDIANCLKTELVRNGFDVKIGNPEDTVYVRVAEATEWGADYYIPIHTNASSNSISAEGKAYGPLLLAYGKVGGNSYLACKSVYDRIMEVYPRKSNRGVVINTTFYEIIKTPMLSVYPEIAFHDNGYDAKWLVENKEQIATAICKGICDFYKKVYIPEQIVENPNVGCVTEDEWSDVVKERDLWKTKYTEIIEKLKDVISE